MASPKGISISSMPDEVLELIASQLDLTFRDVIAFSSTSRRVHATTAFLIAKPLQIENQSGTDILDDQIANPSLGLVRAVIISVKFTLADSHSQTEQLRKLLSRAPRIRYLSLSRPNPDSLDNTPRYEPSRSKTAVHPFPLRSSHFTHPGAPYLSDLTHLSLTSLSVHPMLFSRFPRLMHLKLSLAPHRDAYVATDALNIIAFAKICKLEGFEIGLHAGMEQRERLGVVKACVSAWPGLRTLNLLSVEGGRVPSLFDRWQKPEGLGPIAKDLADALVSCPNLQKFSIGLVPVDGDTLSLTPVPLVNPLPGSFAAIASLFRTSCPDLETVRCLVPLAPRAGKRPFAEFYEVGCAKLEGERWQCVREGRNEGLPIFGLSG